MIERWKDVIGYEDVYQVSNLGRVKRIKKSQGAKVRILTLSQRKTNKYLVVCLSQNNKSKTHYVHRLVLKAFIGKPSRGSQCCHKNGDPTNNRVENLYWGSIDENALDRIKHGTSLQGTLNPNSKLTAYQVREIRVANGTHAKIAKKYGVARRTIGRIKAREIWKHI